MCQASSKDDRATESLAVSIIIIFFDNFIFFFAAGPSCAKRRETHAGHAKHDADISARTRPGLDDSAHRPARMSVDSTSCLLPRPWPWAVPPRPTMVSAAQRPIAERRRHEAVSGANVAASGASGDRPRQPAEIRDAAPAAAHLVPSHRVVTELLGLVGLGLC